MGPRIREDNGGERRWIPAPVFTGSGLCAGATEWGGDGSPHPRGQRRGETMDSRPCLHGQALRGGNEVGRRWVPASARTTEGREDGFPPPREQRRWEPGSPHPRGQRRGEEMGPRIREDNGGEEVEGWVPASAGTTEGSGALVQEGYGTGLNY